jgi:hypothetical protein
MELSDYLRWLATEVEVIVVDGSPPSLFAAHSESWGAVVKHVPPRVVGRGENGKVGGVLTGVEIAGHEAVVIADDDVRYDLDGLREVARLLQESDLVRPQNYFDPLPWHARWDTARTLINRAVAHDFPGTLGVRRSALRATGGYDPTSLFENLELIRTIEAAGGSVANRRGLFVRRLPPTSAQFKDQRVRQAYESLGQPERLVLELAMLPASAALVGARRTGLLSAGCLGLVALAELGRRRAGGRAVFPATCSLFAPAWAAERGLCVWIALWLRVRRGGLRYADETVTKAANSKRVIRSRLRRAGWPNGPRASLPCARTPVRRRLVHHSGTSIQGRRRPMPEFAQVNTADGFQVGDYLILRIAGEKPAPCYIVSIELAPIDIFPPEFNATWAIPPAVRCMQVVTPYEVVHAFHIGSQLEKVTLNAEGGAIEVSIEHLPPLEPGPVTPTEPILAADIVLPPSEAVGYSNDYDLGEAVRNAIEQLPPRGRGIPDWLSTYTVVEIGAQVGGIAGWNRLFAKVRG